uniref:G_PROTEIN_RECEP_F1_2 domain-containing protein n=1 Tax=Globodera pallida TaxID=36090 RepID=A0A183C2Y2_GLOPA
MTFFNDPVVLSGAKAFVAVIMILSNSILVFVTYKTKTLNSTCNWLIAANSACIALYSLTYFVQFGIVLLRPSGIPLWQCCLLIPVPLFFLCCQYILLPLIALDRLIGVIFPLKQMGSRYKRHYMFFALVASTSFGLFIVAASVNNSIIDFSENLVFCMTSEPAPAYIGFVMQLTLSLNGPILYALSSDYRTAFRAVLRIGKPSQPTKALFVVPAFRPSAARSESKGKSIWGGVLTDMDKRGGGHPTVTGRGLGSNCARPREAGPGTGKTFTAAAIMAAILKEDPSARVLALAPTNIAAVKLVMEMEGVLRVEVDSDLAFAEQTRACSEA